MAVPLIARNISRLIRETGTQGKVLAQRLQVSQQAVSQWTTGQLVPTSERLGQIAEALNVEVDELTRDTWAAATVPIKHYKLDLFPRTPAEDRLVESPNIFLSYNSAETFGWSRPEEIAAVQVKDHNLEPTVWAGELLFVDLSWRAITLSDLYLLDFAGLPVFRWCHLLVPGTVNVSDCEMDRDVPESDLAVLGRVVGRFSSMPIRK
jgi:transcriptional regulator with XRE-family HTH domain